MTTHSGEKHFSCDQCNYSCNQAGNLKTHMRQHTGEKPFTCNQCIFSCSDSSNLRTHKLMHTGEKPFVCKKCEYACRHPGHLRRHMKKTYIRGINTGQIIYQWTSLCYNSKCSYRINVLLETYLSGNSHKVLSRNSDKIFIDCSFVHLCVSL